MGLWPSEWFEPNTTDKNIAEKKNGTIELIEEPESVADPAGGNPAMALHPVYRLWAPSNEEVNMRYWDTLNCPP